MIEERQQEEFQRKDKAQMENEPKKKIRLKYSVISFWAGAFALMAGVLKRLYLQGYYNYFDIDMKYVSINLYWDLADIA